MRMGDAVSRMQLIGLKPLQKVDWPHSVVPCGDVPQKR